MLFAYFGRHLAQFLGEFMGILQDEGKGGTGGVGAWGEPIGKGGGELNHILKMIQRCTQSIAYAVARAS